MPRYVKQNAWYGERSDSFLYSNIWYKTIHLVEINLYILMASFYFMRTVIPQTNFRLPTSNNLQLLKSLNQENIFENVVCIFVPILVVPRYVKQNAWYGGRSDSFLYSNILYKTIPFVTQIHTFWWRHLGFPWEQLCHKQISDYRPQGTSFAEMNKSTHFLFYYYVITDAFLFSPTPAVTTVYRPS